MWKPPRDTQQDWSPSVVLISLPPTQIRRYQLRRAICFLKRFVSCTEDENNDAVSFFSKRISAGCKRAGGPQRDSYLRWRSLRAICVNLCPGPTECVCLWTCEWFTVDKYSVGLCLMWLVGECIAVIWSASLSVRTQHTVCAFSVTLHAAHAHTKTHTHSHTQIHSWG